VRGITCITMIEADMETWGGELGEADSCPA
jgi:hypothetical protein